MTKEEYNLAEKTSIMEIIKYFNSLPKEEALYAIETGFLDEYGLKRYQEKFIRYINGCNRCNFNKEEYDNDNDSETFYGNFAETLFAMYDSEKYATNLNACFTNAYCCVEETYDGKTLVALPLSEILYDGDKWTLKAANCGRLTFDAIVSKMIEIINAHANAKFCSRVVLVDSNGIEYDKKYWYSNDKDGKLFFFSEKAKESIGLIHPGNKLFCENIA